MKSAADLDADALKRSAALASIGVASLLVVLKIWAAWSTGSTAMLGSLADSTLDLIASLATLAGVWIASHPADVDHRFGHGKAEALAAMFQVVLIGFSALALAFDSVGAYLAGSRPQAAEQGIIVSVVALAATVALIGWQRHVLARTGSIAIATDNLHYRSDLMVNGAVIAALALDRWLGIKGIDPLFGLGIAGWLGWGAWGAAQTAMDQLMDHEWPEAQKDRFLEVLGRCADLSQIHDLRTRASGNHDFVQFHLWMDGRTSVAQAHEIMDRIEARLHAEFPALEVLIHPDPIGHTDPGLAGEPVVSL